MAPTSGFFQSNIFFIFFAYGLAFCLMGVVKVVESRRTSALNLARSLWLLGGFGLLNGVVGWIGMFMVMPRPTPGLAVNVLTHVIQLLNCFDCHQRLGRGRRNREDWSIEFAVDIKKREPGRPSASKGGLRRKYKRNQSSLTFRSI